MLFIFYFKENIGIPIILFSFSFFLTRSTAELTHTCTHARRYIHKAGRVLIFAFVPGTYMYFCTYFMRLRSRRTRLYIITVVVELVVVVVVVSGERERTCSGSGNYTRVRREALPLRSDRICPSIIYNICTHISTDIIMCCVELRVRCV